MPTSNDNDYTPSTAIPDFLIRHVSLRQLQVFEAIFRLGSFTRAAEELFLTQPTVSMQIKKLTDSMGLPLFEHVGRSVEPTEAGKELYQTCRKIFESLSNLEMKIADLKGLKRGRLRLCVVTIAKYLVPEMLGEFSKLYPGIDLAMKVTNRESIIERMNANEYDLYIMGQVPEELDVKSYQFAPNPLVVLAPRNHPLVGKKNIKLEEIAKEPFLMREQGSGMRDATFRAFDRKGLRPQVRMELGSNEAIKHAVVGGLGLSVMSLHTLVLEGIDGPVAVLDVEGFPLMREWYMVYPKSKELSLVSRTFLDFAVEYESTICDRMESLLPAIKNAHQESKTSASKKSNSKAKKK
ncbi:MAG: LysR substrate-binding domain-containing protein [Arenicellales bacterium]|jgi:DNA-binding transcriptional LysR family regulator